MSSSLKTNHYQLNNWIGSDKPKREDFNSDNEKVDRALNDLSEKVSAHQEDMQTHLTQKDRTSWEGKPALETGSYMGDGATNRAIELGYQPKALFLFRDWSVFQSIDFLAKSTGVCAGIGIPEGGTMGLTLYETGFSVMEVTTTSPTGQTPRLNTNGVTYYYLAFR